jgi:hypothetical protein
MMSSSNSLFLKGAGSPINRSVTVRTIARLWHPRTGTNVFLADLSATTELVIVNLVPQHDPQSNPERLLARVQVASYLHLGLLRSERC